MDPLFKMCMNNFSYNNENNAVIYAKNNQNKTYFYEYTYQHIKSKCISLQKIIGTAKFDKRIGIYIDNCPEFLMAFISSIYGGFTVVAINTKASTDEIKKIVSENNIILILTVSYMSKDIMNYNYIEVDNIEEIDGEINFISGEPNDIVIISYTSGTSGNYSKGAMLSIKNINFIARKYKEIYNLTKQDNIILTLPCWHNYGMIACICSSLEAGCKLSIMNQWTTDSFIKLNLKYKPTVFPGSPYMYIDIMNQSNIGNALTSLKICDSGGDTLSIECIKKFEEVSGAIITEGYGLTETSSLTHFNISARDRKIGSIGKGINGVECKIIDLQGKKLPVNSWGILWIKGEMVFSGYVQSELNKGVLTEDGWFNTGDVVKIDEQGFYYIAGRYSDIKSINNNVKVIRNIEDDLFKCEGIKRVYVEQVHNKELNFFSYNIYLVNLSDDYNDKVIQYVKEKIKYTIINDVRIVKQIELTATGKIKRQSLLK